MGTRETLNKRFEEYWDWFAVALFLLVTVDMLTTMGATVEYGLAAEINPLVVWLLRHGLVAFMLANLVVVVLAVGAFSGVVEAVQRARAPYDAYLVYGIEVWLGVLLSMGLFVFANNLSVIVHGRSLVGLVV